jgi:uncharacterized membrane protein
MANEFIMPNWHPLFIHFPIALLILGFVIEIISVGRPRGGFRAAGRWMMLLGALLALPAVTAGIYAFRDVAAPGGLDVDEHWQQVLARSTWSPQQWDVISDHIWYNSVAVFLFLAAVVVWLGSSDKWRRSIYLPALIVTLVGVILMIIGASHGGELVYRYGTGVEVGAATVEPATSHTAEYYIPPLQLHLVLAGFVVAFVVAGLALMIRRWQLDSLAAAAPEEGQPVAPAIVGLGEPTGGGEGAQPGSNLAQDVGHQDNTPPSEVYPGWFWLGAFGLALATAAAGAWSVLGVFTRTAFQENLADLRQADHRRLTLHVVLGISIIVLSLILACLVRFARRRRRPAGILAGLLLLLIAWQIWVGTLMTYDSHKGPLTRFASVAQQAEPAAQQPAGPPSSAAPIVHERPAAPPAKEPSPTAQAAPAAGPLAVPGPQSIPVPPTSPQRPGSAAPSQEPAQPGGVPHEEIGA